MDRMTVIVVPDETSPVRRYQVPRRLVTRGPWIALAVALVVIAGAVDYVRLRLQAVDVARLRAETHAHSKVVGGLSEQVGSLESEFERLREFERKVRVIANLPAAVVEAEVPSGRGGQGGPADGDEQASEGEAPPAAPRGAGFPPVDLGGDGPLAWLLADVHERSLHLSSRASHQVERFHGLVEGLEGMRERLAATPSIWPSTGWVTSGFGTRVSPFTGRRQFHAGLDIAADFGTEIVAPAAGRVTFVGTKGALGRTVVIDHGYGLRTTYGHAAELFVKGGQRVERGSRIASIGSTGRSTGPHLHYGIEVHGRAVDPRDYIVD